jgi:excisionase family DNA binding protein
MTTDPLLTVEQAAAYLGMGCGFVYRHAAALGGRKVGSRLKFTLTDLSAYLDRQKIAAPVVAPAPARPVDIRTHRQPVGKVTGRRYAAPARQGATR